MLHISFRECEVLLEEKVIPQKKKYLYYEMMSVFKAFCKTFLLHIFDKDLNIAVHTRLLA